MLSKIRQRSWEVGQSLAGDGMLLRLRNASIALVGAVAAVGLGLTLFISQLGFPAVFNGPIPGNPAEAGRVHNAIALTQGPAVGPSSPAPSSRSSAAASRHPRQAGDASGPGGGGDRGGSNQTAVSPGTQQGPAGQSPVASVPAPAPAAPAAEPSPSAPSPVPVTAVVVSQPKSSADGQPQGGSGGGSKPSAPSTAKVTSDGSGKSKGVQTSKSDSGQTVSGAKQTSPSEKAAKDQSAAAPPAPAAPPAAPSGKSASEASPAAAKEAADSGK
jgi:hypothetical protein